MAGNTMPERMARLEAQHKVFAAELTSINAKLDDLLALKYKGLGAFWLASALVGAGAISVISWLATFVRGAF